jgi:hypothetical protein
VLLIVCAIQGITPDVHGLSSSVALRILSSSMSLPSTLPNDDPAPQDICEAVRPSAAYPGHGDDGAGRRNDLATDGIVPGQLHRTLPPPGRRRPGTFAPPGSPGGGLSPPLLKALAPTASTGPKEGPPFRTNRSFADSAPIRNGRPCLAASGYPAASDGRRRPALADSIRISLMA